MNPISIISSVSVRLFAAGLILASLGCAAPARAQEPKRAITFDDLISMHRVSDPQISPDGKWVAYVVSMPDMKANHSFSNIWVVPASGGDERQITRGGSDNRPRWSPDSQRIAFLSSRDGQPQVYTISLYGGEATRLTFLSTGADNELWSPDGKMMAFVSRVYPDCRDDACNEARDEAAKKKSREGAHRHTLALSPLDRLGRRKTQPSVRHCCKQRNSARFDSGRGLRCAAV